jgi:Flp pilus assembly protein TadG
MGTFMPRSIPLRRSRHRSRGQSMAEFAIVFPIFMLVVGGIIQFGIIFWGQNTLNQIVRDSGRYAVTERDCSPGSQADVQSHIDSVVSNGSFAGAVTAKTLVMPTDGQLVGTPAVADPVSDKMIGGVSTPTPNYCPPTSNAEHVWLRITVNAQVPIFFPFVPGNGNISSTALFRMEPVTAP